MLTRRLGNADLVVPIVGLGAGHIGGPDSTSDDVERLLRRAVERGAHLIDTAPSYGLSEERIARFIAPIRGSVILSTKCGYGIRDVEDWTHRAVALGVDRALEKFGVDVIDVMFLHSCPRSTLERGDVIAALVTAREQGKVRAIGYSGENEALEYALSIESFDVVQCSVNVCDQWSLRHWLGKPQTRPVGVFAKRPLANAFWRHATQPLGSYAETYWLRAQKMGLSFDPIEWPRIALRFAAFAPGVHTALIGTSNPANLDALLDAVEEGPLSLDLQRHIEERFSSVGSDWCGQI